MIVADEVLRVFPAGLGISLICADEIKIFIEEYQRVYGVLEEGFEKPRLFVRDILGLLHGHLQSSGRVECALF
jgi:hypothetical protein